METFEEKFRNRYQLSEADASALLSHMEEVRFKKKEVIVQEGTKNTNLYLIKEGIWRGHYLKHGVEAMSDSIAYCISKAVLNELYSTSIGLANLGRRLMEHQLLTTENWLISAGSPRAKERYLTLIKETPELLLHVPLKYIASYLWITPQSLSRIRAGIGKGK